MKTMPFIERWNHCQDHVKLLLRSSSLIDEDREIVQIFSDSSDLSVYFTGLTTLLCL